MLKQLGDAGFSAFLVGGCVRDSLLSRRPGDWDAASSATPEQVTALFPRTVPTGIKHGTVTVLTGGGKVELTTFRSDGGYSDRRHPDSVVFGKSIDEDLRRRDFTINAMAMTASLEIYDPLGGVRDIERKIIRCVGDPRERFSEDALRMPRAVRFSAQLSFEIEENTMDALRELSDGCRVLSPERVRTELEKTLKSGNPAAVLTMARLGLLDAYLDKSALTGIEPALKSVPCASRLARLCAYLEDCGAVADTGSFLRSLRFDNATTERTVKAVGVLKSPSRDWKRLLRDCGEDAVRAAYPKNAPLRSVLRSGDCRSIDALAVRGGDLYALGFRGREIGSALDALLEYVIDNPKDNDREILIGLLKEGEIWQTGRN